MNRVVMLLLVLAGLSAVKAEVESSTTSGVNVGDGGDDLRLDTRGPFWEKLSVGKRAENGHRSFNPSSSFNKNNNEEDGSKMSLKEFLDAYAKKNNKKPLFYDDDTTQSLDQLIDVDENGNENPKDKSKSTWTLLNVQKHKHPFDDRKGWVSLDPVPWSISKISKWQSKYKPSSERPWEDHGPISSQRPYLQEDDELEFNRPVSITPPSPYIYHRPTESSDKYDTYYNHRDPPRPTTPVSNFPRPTAYFGHKIHVDTHFPTNSYSSTGKPYFYHNKKDFDRPNHPYDEIITDGQPANFPLPSPYDSFRRRGTEMEIHSENHPFNGEGEWILLSTTKGYKPPRNRQRSLQIGSTSQPNQTIRASRGVSLTVLPPLKGSNINMTTSHGGLLQVESTFESVEQAKQKFDKRQDTIKIKDKRKRRKSYKINPNSHVQNGSKAVESVPQFGDPSAVLAAVGAGIIPATMAMMVPIAMGSG